MKKIAVLVGSLQEKSINRQLAKNFETLADGKLEFNYVDMNLPLFNQDLEENVPEAVEAARQIVAGSDGVLILSPEYNRSPTGVLKNAIDWLSRPYAEGVILNKKVAIAGASWGPLATGPAQGHLRSIVGYLNMPLMGQPEFYLAVTPETFDDSGALVDNSHAEKYVQALEKFL